MNFLDNNNLINLFLLFQVFNIIIVILEYNFFVKITQGITILQKTKLSVLFIFPTIIVSSIYFNPL